MNARPLHSAALTLVLKVLVPLALVLVCVAQPDLQLPDEQATGSPPAARPSFDDATGRSLLTYPISTGINLTDVKLEVLIADMNAATLETKATYDFKALGWPVGEVKFQSSGLRVIRVESPDQHAEFSQSEGTLTIALRPPVAVGAAARITVWYLVSDPASDGAWTSETPAPKAKAAQFNTAFLESWYPRPESSDPFTSQISVDVPFGFLVCAPGRLVERTKSVSGASSSDTARRDVHPRELFRWAQDTPAGGDAFGRLDVVVGKFDVVDVGTSSVPMLVYAPIGRGGDARAAFSGTPAILETLGKRFGATYPWARYAKILVADGSIARAGRPFESSLAMSLVSDRTLDRGIAAADRNSDIARSASRQWFGHLLCVRSAEHLWMQEAFAAYAATLWRQPEGTAAHPHEADGSLVRAWFDASIADAGSTGIDRPDAPRTSGIVSKNYDPRTPAGRQGADPRSKGAVVLHMLRQRLGDRAFFNGIAGFVGRSQRSPVETSDLRRAMEEASGESLEQFFEQWCFRPGVPVLDVRTRWLADSKELQVEVRQRQNIDADNPAFAFALPVWIPDRVRGPGSADPTSGRVYSIDVTGRVSTLEISLDSEPEFVAVDAGMSVLGAFSIEQPELAWIAQLSRAPTPAASVQAARELGRLLSAPARAALRSAAESARSEWVRSECRRALTVEPLSRPPL